jgi:hypothetical protein
MTKHALEILLEHIATWPEETQEELVQSVAISRRDISVSIASTMRSDLLCGVDFGRCEKGKASEEEVAAAFARYRA